MQPIQAPNPAFREVVKKVVGTMPAAKFLGFDFDSIEPGFVRLKLEARSELMEHLGAFQGGIIGALIDFCGASSCGTLLKENHLLMSLDYSTKLLAPAKAKVLIAEGNVLNAGTSISTAIVSVYNESPEGQLCASGLVTTRNFPI